MELGQIVWSRAGSDKNNFFVIIGVDDKVVYISDGKRYKISAPKRKNIKHLAVTGETLEKENFSTDKSLRKALAVFRSQH